MSARTLALLATLGLTACSGGDEAVEPPGLPVDAPVARGLLVISIDTLRADRLGAYGCPRETSPALDAFAARGVVFEQAWAESSWTIPSHVTLLSGLHPASHAVERPDEKPGDDVVLLAERLRDAGFYTFAQTGGGWLTRRRGFDQGFLSFRGQRRELALVLPAFERHFEDLVGSERRFFGFLHTYDVHCPYDPPEPYGSMFVSASSEALRTAGRCGNPQFNSMDLSPAQEQFLSERYDGGIRQADDVLGAFLARLEESGLLEELVVVITSDHGEEFGEHGQIGHHASLQRELLSIPLIVRAPGVAPARITTPVGLADVVPTVLELLGLPPLEGVDGRSLAPLLFGGAPPAHEPRVASLAWNGNLVSLLDGSEHLVLDLDTGARSLFDVASDPDGQHDLAGERVARADALEADLRARLAALEANARVAAPAGPLTRAEKADVDALGYGGDDD